MILKKKYSYVKKRNQSSVQVSSSLFSHSIFFNTTPLNAKAVVCFVFTPVKQLILSYYSLLALMQENR